MARVARACLAGLLAVAVPVSLGGPAHAAAPAVLLADGFHDATVGSNVFAVTDGAGDDETLAGTVPCLTAGPTTGGTPIPGCGLAEAADAAGSGVLRLTDTGGGEVAGIVGGSSFPLSAGLNAQFKLYMYGGSGADGISFDLAAAPPAQTGQPGGPLGYGSENAVVAGMAAGWLGVGFDTFGSYETSNADGTGCTNPNTHGPYSNNVTVRGPGNGTVGYCIVSTTLSGSGNSTLPFTMDGGPSGTRAGSVRGVQIVIDPTAGTYTVGMDQNGGTDYTAVTSGALPNSYFDSSGNTHTGLPDQLTFAIVGSEGAATDNHEISDLTVSTLGSAGPPTVQLPGPGPDHHHNDHAGSNDPNPNTNPSADTTTATSTEPTVSTTCRGSCTLKAITRDERFVIDAIDTSGLGSNVPASFRAASLPAGEAPNLSLTIDGGGAKPNCPGYRTSDRDWVQFGFDSGGSTFRKTGTMTSEHGFAHSEADSRLAHEQVCFAAPYRFPTRLGFRLHRSAGWFDGVLADCTALGVHAPAAPCLVSREVVRVGDGWGLRLIFQVPPGRQDPKALG